MTELSGPLMLQDHIPNGGPMTVMRFRNIWFRAIPTASKDRQRTEAICITGSHGCLSRSCASLYGCDHGQCADHHRRGQRGTQRRTRRGRPRGDGDAVSETRGTKVADAHTNENGDFVFPNVPGDTYTVEVTLEGFKTLRRTGLLVSPGDRVVVPTMTLSVGGLGKR